MKKPLVLVDKVTKRTPVVASGIAENLILAESILRRAAYKNSSIKTGESFFDDSDMGSEYYLIIVYHKKLNTPLLTARYYFDKSAIAKCLNGDSSSENEKSAFHINKFKEGEVFLIDRMSGNSNSSTYRQYRNYIHFLFYSEILTHNKDCKLIAMARREKHEKLLTKYIRLGFNIVGTTIHKEKEHWILVADLKRSWFQLKFSILFNSMLITKYLLSKLHVK
jgi:hypothetical protein